MLHWYYSLFLRLIENRKREVWKKIIKRVVLINIKQPKNIRLIKNIKPLKNKLLHYKQIFITF